MKQKQNLTFINRKITIHGSSFTCYYDNNDDNNNENEEDAVMRAVQHAPYIMACLQNLYSVILG
jgi:hypothetical protein